MPKYPVPRRCSMSSTLDRPWTCGSGDCMGRHDDCGAKAQNEAEQEWIAQAEHERDNELGDWDPWVSALMYFLGEPAYPEISVRAARQAHVGHYREDRYAMDDLILVSSAYLQDAADSPAIVLRNGVRASAAQLAMAAELLRVSEPSICNGVTAERPGYIDANRQKSDDVLVFEIGILPCETYRIDRKGELV